MTFKNIERIKKTKFIDIVNNIEYFGIKAKTLSGDWLYFESNGKPLLYTTEESRDLKMKEIRKKIRESK